MPGYAPKLLERTHRLFPIGNIAAGAVVATSSTEGVRTTTHMSEKDDKEAAAERQAPSGAIVYKAISREGEEELERSSSALFWSALAAGLSMGFSMIAEGLLTTHLPDTSWRILIAKFGYSIGFLIVILGRQQLFTENTLTPILPLLRKKDRKTLFNVARLWSIVFIANLVGALIIGVVAARSAAFDAPVQDVFIEMGHEAMKHGFAIMVLRAIFAGWLIAMMVWLLPFAESARVWVIIFVTYIVGLGQFGHIIAGAVEVFALAAAGQAAWGSVAGSFLLPTFIGNVLGGVLLVATINHAQVIAGGEGEDL
jgi:formate/nitrite transporter FocA (FNT family)